MPAENPASNRVVKIVSSGVHFETKSGKAYTDKAASFTFEDGSGKATGADYDPDNRQLHMKSQVELNWRGRGPKAPHESGDRRPGVFRARRQSGAYAVGQDDARHYEDGRRHHLRHARGGSIRLIESQNARGVSRMTISKVEYAAEHLTLQFTTKDRLI